MLWCVDRARGLALLCALLSLLELGYVFGLYHAHDPRVSDPVFRAVHDQLFITGCAAVLLAYAARHVGNALHDQRHP